MFWLMVETGHIAAARGIGRMSGDEMVWGTDWDGLGKASLMLSALNFTVSNLNFDEES